MIRKYEEKDFAQVKTLLALCNIDSGVTQEELKGYALVNEDEGFINGFVWCLFGESSAVYIDHLCVHPDYRQKDLTGRSKILVEMILRLLGDMALMGKKKVMSHLHETDTGQSLERIFNTMRLKIGRPRAFVWGNPHEVMFKIKDLRQG